MKPHWILFGLAGVVIIAAPTLRLSSSPVSRPSHPAAAPVSAVKAAEPTAEAPWDAHQPDPPAEAKTIEKEAPLYPPISQPEAGFSSSPPDSSTAAFDGQQPLNLPAPLQAAAGASPARHLALPSANSSSLSQVIEQVRSTKQLVEGQFAALQRDHEATQRELAARKQQVAALEQRLSALAQQLAERDKRLHELESLRQTLQSDLQENTDQMNALQKTVDQLEREKRNLPRQLGELKLRNDKLEQEAQELRNARREAGDARRQLERLSKEVDQKNRTIDRLNRELESNRAEMQEVADHLSAIQRDRSDLEAQHKENLSAMESVQARVDELTHDLEQEEQQIVSLQEVLAQRDLQLKQSEAIIQVLQQKSSGSRLTAFAQPDTTQAAGQPRSHFEAYLRSRRQGWPQSSPSARRKASWWNH